MTKALRNPLHLHARLWSSLLDYTPSWSGTCFNITTPLCYLPALTSLGSLGCHFVTIFFTFRKFQSRYIVLSRHDSIISSAVVSSLTHDVCLLSSCVILVSFYLQSYKFEGFSLIYDLYFFSSCYSDIMLSLVM